MKRDWSDIENRLIITDYFDMLLKESMGLDYVKAEHRRALRPKLDDRSDSALEYKYQNISAVLKELGLELPNVQGYKPASNYQQALRDAVDAYLRDEPGIIPKLLDAAAGSVPPLDTLSSLKEVPSPEKLDWSKPPQVQKEAPPYSHLNYLTREAENRKLGRLGEQAVLTYEKHRLTKANRPHLAEQIEWTAKVIGDMAGYDIQSFNLEGEPLYIEVKTTKHGIGFPFFISASEVAFSESHANAYCLYRVFSFRRYPRLYIKCGSVSSAFRLRPRLYQAWP